MINDQNVKMYGDNDNSEMVDHRYAYGYVESIHPIEQNANCNRSIYKYMASHLNFNNLAKKTKEDENFFFTIYCLNNNLK